MHNFRSALINTYSETNALDVASFPEHKWFYDQLHFGVKCAVNIALLGKESQHPNVMYGLCATVVVVDFKISRSHQYEYLALVLNENCSMVLAKNLYQQVACVEQCLLFQNKIKYFLDTMIQNFFF